MAQRLPQVGVRVSDELRALIQAEADTRFGGNESLVLRHATEIYLQLRQRFGPTLDIMLAAWLNDDGVTPTLLTRNPNSPPEA